MIKPITPGSFWQPRNILNCIYTGGSFSIKDNLIYLLMSGTIYNVDYLSREVENVIKFENEEILCFDLSPDGINLSIFTKSTFYKIWNIEQNVITKNIKSDGTYAIDILYDPSSTLFAASLSDHSIGIYYPDKGSMIKKLKEHRGVINAMKWHPQKEKFLLITGSIDNTIKIWDVFYGHCLSTFKYNSVCNAICFSTEGYTMITSHKNKSIAFWDFKENKLINSKQLEKEPIFIHYFKKQKQSFLILVNEEGTVEILSIKGMLIQSEWKIYENMQFISAKFIEKSKTIICSSNEFSLICFSWQNEELMPTKEWELLGFNEDVISISTLLSDSSSNEYRIAIATNSTSLKLWNPKDNKIEIRQIHQDFILSIEIIDNYLITGSKDRTASVWKINNLGFELLFTLTGHEGAVNNVAMSPKNHYFLITSSKDSTIKKWNIKEKLENPTKDLNIEAITRKIHKKEITSIKISPNDKYLATSSLDRTVKIFKCHSLLLLKSLEENKRGMWDIAFSPIEQLFAAAGGDGSINIYSLPSCEIKKKLLGHNSSVLKICWVNLGLKLISAGSEGQIKIWNTKTGECINSYTNHSDKIWTLTYNEKLNLLISGGSDSQVIIWEDFSDSKKESKDQEMNNIFFKDNQIWTLKNEGNLIEAAKLSFELNKKREFMDTINEILNENNLVQDPIDQSINEIILTKKRRKSEQENIINKRIYSILELVKWCYLKDPTRLLRICRDYCTISRCGLTTISIIFSLVISAKHEKLIDNSGLLENDKEMNEFGKKDGLLEMFKSVIQKQKEKYVKCKKMINILGKALEDINDISAKNNTKF